MYHERRQLERNIQVMGRSKQPAFLYLHGLGSSPQAGKATLFRTALSAQGYHIEVPDLSVPSFERLSLVAILNHILDTLRRLMVCNDVIILASSFGAFLGIHSVQQLSSTERESIKAMFLFAPVFFIKDENCGLITGAMERQWRERGAFSLPYGEPPVMVPVRVSFLDEVSRCEAGMIDARIPTTLFHGEDDDVVPIFQSRRYAEMCPHIELVSLSGGHSLLNHADLLVSEVSNRIKELDQNGSIV